MQQNLFSVVLHANSHVGNGAHVMFLTNMMALITQPANAYKAHDHWVALTGCRSLRPAQDAASVLQRYKQENPTCQIVTLDTSPQAPASAQDDDSAQQQPGGFEEHVCALICGTEQQEHTHIYIVCTYIHICVPMTA